MSVENTVAPPIKGCIEACERCEQVLDAITDEMFKGARPGHQSIGAHLRHALEHMLCFVRGLPEGLVDYDSRDRDEALEHDSQLFRKKLSEITSALSEIPSERLNDTLSIRQMASLDSKSEELSSTVGRELVFISSHTIHHLALVVSFCREEGVDLPEETSLAFSTSAYLKTTAS